MNALVRAIVEGRATEDDVAVFTDWLEEHARTDDATRARNGESLAVAIAAVLESDSDFVESGYELLIPMLVEGMAGRLGTFERTRAALILDIAELGLAMGAIGEHRQWRRACDAIRKRQRERPTYEELHGFVACAGAIPELTESRSVPWCMCQTETEREVVILGALYTAASVALAFELRFDRAEQGWAWTLMFDELDADGESKSMSFWGHPSRWDGDVTSWRHRFHGTASEPLRVTDESSDTWNRVFALVIADGDALTLCDLLDAADDLHANDHSLDMFSMNVLGGARMSERGIAALVADLLNQRDLGSGASREYYAYYRSTRGIDATNEEKTRFLEACASRGVVFRNANGQPVRL